MNIRHTALLALEAHRIAEALGDLEGRDLALARELASGTCRRRRTLDWWISGVARLPKKQRERNLLRLTLYQIAYTRIPPYAAIDEGVKLAKQLFHPRFSAFLNATMRKLAKNRPEPEDLAIRTSYPDWFVERISDEEVLAAMNQPPVLMARKRPSLIPEPVERVEPPEWIVQNISQALLLKEATEGLRPQSILDLCAAPGGKLIALADRFPQADLFANDLRMERLEENLKTYQVDAQVRRGRGEEYPQERQFDLVVVDTPCSNSGVLGKRPEARWRLDQEQIDQLVQLQDGLVQHAAKLVAPGGVLLYMTCSILPEENHPRLEWQRRYEQTILPHGEYDGGYACALERE